MLLAWGLSSSSRCIPNCLVENTLQVTLCEGGAFQVLLCFDLLGDYNCLLVLNWRHLLLPERLFGGLVVSQIELRTDKNDGHAWCMVVNLGVPLRTVSRDLLAIEGWDLPSPLRCRTMAG